MKYEEMKKLFDEIISKELSDEYKKKKLEPIFVKHKHYVGILYKGFCQQIFSYNIKKEEFSKKIIKLLKREYGGKNGN